MNWLKLLQVLRKGSAVADPAAWKSKDIAATTVVGAVLAAYQFAVSAGWLPEGLTDLITAFGAGVGIVCYVAFRIYAIVATTEKVGLKQRHSPGPDNDRDLDLAILRKPEGPNRPSQVSPHARGDTGGDEASDYDRLMGEN